MAKISLIISFYNKIELLKLILVALEEQTLRDFEVIIADDGSTLDVVDEIHRLKDSFSFSIKHVWHEDLGWRKNAILNQAVLASKSDYLVFIDGDCIPHRQFLQEHLEFRKESQVLCGRRVLLTAKVSKKLSANRIQKRYLGYPVFFDLLWETLFLGKKTYLEQMIHLRSKWLRQLVIKERQRYILGCNFSLWKEDILRVNGFDERFKHPGYGEDIDLEQRLAAIGIPAISCKCALLIFHVYHVHFDTDYAPNKALLEENKIHQIAVTPFGIHKIEE